MAVNAKQAANLQPFDATPEGRERARELGRRSAEVRKAKRLARQSEGGKALAGLPELRESLQETQQEFGEVSISQATRAVAAKILSQLAAGEIKVEGKDAAGLLDTLIGLARLEEGQSTSNAVVAHISTAAAMEKVKELRASPPPSGLLEVEGIERDNPTPVEREENTGSTTEPTP